jgi:hypothetical protein
LLLTGKIGDWQSLAKLCLSSFVCLTIALVISKSSHSEKRDFINMWISGALFLGFLVWVAFLSNLISSSWFSNQVIFIGWRASGTFPDPNIFALYLLISIGLALSNILQGLSPALGAAVILLSSALALSNSRSAFLALGAMIVVGLALSFREWRLWFAAAAAMASTIFATGIYLAGGLIRNFPSSEVSVLGATVRTNTRLSVQGDVRFDFWRAALETSTTQSYFGAGFGQAEEVLRDSLFWTWNGGTPHNSFITLFLEAGPLGLVLVVGALVVLTVRLTFARDLQRVGVAATLISVIVFLNGFDMLTSTLVWGFIGFATGMLSPPAGKRPIVTAT